MSNDDYKRLIIESAKEIVEIETLVFIYTVVKNLTEWGEGMSVRIKVSYECEEELAKVIQLLTPEIKSCKVAKRQEGKYRRAYINLKHEGSPNEAWKGANSWMIQI